MKFKFITKPFFWWQSIANQLEYSFIKRRLEMGVAMWSEWLEDSMCQVEAPIITEQLPTDAGELSEPGEHIQQQWLDSPERDAVEESSNIPPLYRVVDSNVMVLSQITPGNNVQISKGCRSYAWVSHDNAS